MSLMTENVVAFPQQEYTEEENAAWAAQFETPDDEEYTTQAAAFEEEVGDDFQLYAPAEVDTSSDPFYDSDEEREIRMHAAYVRMMEINAAKRIREHAEELKRREWQRQCDEKADKMKGEAFVQVMLICSRLKVGEQYVAPYGVDKLIAGFTSHLVLPTEVSGKMAHLYVPVARRS